jgi:DNA polymerase III delta prime subunit
VFSCSNAQKIIENVQSRVQIVGLEPPTRGHLEQLYRRIVEEEGLNERIDKNSAVAPFVLDLAQGSLREVINILEKIVVYFGTSNDEIITEAQCRDLFLTRIQTSFQELVGKVRQGGLQEGIELMLQIVSNGYSIVDIFDAFFKFVKATELLSETEKYEVVRTLCRYITIIHTMHEEKIEIVLFVNALYKLLQTKKI